MSVYSLCSHDVPAAQLPVVRPAAITESVNIKRQLLNRVNNLRAAVVITIFLSGCATTHRTVVQVTPVPTQPCPFTASGDWRYIGVCAAATPVIAQATQTPLPPCPFNYSDKWHQLTNSPVRRLKDPALVKEAQEFLQQLYPDIAHYLFPDPTDIPYYDEPKIYAVQYPDDPSATLMEYDIPLQSHGHVQTLLLRHSDRGWIELQQPPYEHVWYAFLDIDVYGFVRECEGWSLYVKVLNTEYQSNGRGWEIVYRSRDGGQHWQLYPRTIYGINIPSPMISPPSQAQLTSGFYDEERKQLTQFAYIEDTRTLYAFTYPFVPTPAPIATVPTSTPIH